MQTVRISTLIAASLFLYNVTDAYADPPASPSPSPSAQPAPPPPGTPPVETPQANANAPVPGTTATSDARPADEAGRPPLALAIGLGVAGVVCLAAGIGVGAVAKSRADEQSGSVSNPPVYTQSLASRGHEGERMSYAAYALFGVGGAALLADLVVWIEYGRKSKRHETASTSSHRISSTPAGLQVSF